ncbi:hypothetical protein, partial [Gaiella sp.]|uniref:hypothetical protein n=1 Tax=Gaiella sp. TaxID=2663207 RepID=UPI003983C42E
MPRLYGDRITDAESAALIAKLRSRGTPDATIAANTGGKGPGRDTSVATSLKAREAILLELCSWPDLEASAPGLAGIRDRLSG